MKCHWNVCNGLSFRVMADTSVQAAEIKIARICGDGQVHQTWFGDKRSQKRVYRRREVRDMSESSKKMQVGAQDVKHLRLMMARRRADTKPGVR